MRQHQQAQALLDAAEVLFDRQTVDAAIDRVAAEMTARLDGACPLLLAVMSGAVHFAGALLPRLRFPLEFDYIHASRYGDATAGGQLVWRRAPADNVRGRTVVLLDDILDEGHTIAGARARVLETGASECLTAVLTVKENGRPRPLAPDFAGLNVPDRFVFGCGMDIAGYWRNLPEIRALRLDVDPAALGIA